MNTSSQYPLLVAGIACVDLTGEFIMIKKSIVVAGIILLSELHKELHKHN